MPSLVLFFVGSVLLINGLSLLGRIDAKAAAPINAFVGTLLVGVTLYINLPLATNTGDTTSIVLGSTGYLLFGLTYLYVAIGNWSAAAGSGLGWYCGWAALVSVYLSAENYAQFHDAKFGTIWLSWALLFTAFFLVLALNITALTVPAGWLTILEAFTTCTIPGALLLAGKWIQTYTVLVIAAQILVALIFLALIPRARRRQQALTPAAHSVPAAASALIRADGPSA